MRTLLFASIALSVTLPVYSVAAAPDDVFGALTRYVAQQVASDKIRFVGAQRCTEWFYQQLKQRPARSDTHRIGFRRAASASPQSAAECQTRYPEGLESARHAFSQAQSALSISLTFYELALVGDRDDNHRYSETELKDLLESFKLPFQHIAPPTAHVDALTQQFNLARQGNTLEAVMVSMGWLYDKGYRLTIGDRSALSNLSG